MPANENLSIPKISQDQDQEEGIQVPHAKELGPKIVQFSNGSTFFGMTSSGGLASSRTPRPTEIGVFQWIENGTPGSQYIGDIANRCLSLTGVDDKSTPTLDGSGIMEYQQGESYIGSWKDNHKVTV